MRPHFDSNKRFQVIKMTAYRSNASLKKNLGLELVRIISSLKKENILLKKTLAEVSHHHAEHNKLVMKLLALETLLLESRQQLPPKGEKTTLSSEVIKMTAYKSNASLKKKLSSELVRIISSLKKENILLKKTLAEVSHHHAEHNKLVMKLLALETLWLESRQQLPPKGEKTTLSSEDSPSFTNDEAISHLQHKLNDASVVKTTLLTLVIHVTKYDWALEKNKQWLEYDQQREAYVRAILDKMLWLEKHLNETNQAHSKQHNEEHSDAEPQREIKELFVNQLRQADVWLDMLKKQVEVTHQELIIAEKRFRAREGELEALIHQLKSETISKGSPQEGCHNSEEEEQQLREETQELHARLKEEKRRSTNFELQASLYQRYMLNYHHADQEKITDLERQLKISSQDLEDAKRDSSYLKKQMLRILKKLHRAEGLSPDQSKRDQQDLGSCEEAMPPSSSPRDSLASSSHTSVLNDSILECPTCQNEYPASEYRELLKHLEICLE
ncbi:centrosomal protein of 55 kDa-like [Xiphophorus hellerii]|uniref:centrosomal protein of 55 kDa-like n=1 Tax=Xiphophorus hellerii TaxID=8084 RepID=UPI0013B37B06|nr:centrosomal protein of 55 kDa-like [Xiphophorus hellerii]